MTRLGHTVDNLLRGACRSGFAVITAGADVFAPAMENLGETADLVSMLTHGAARLAIAAAWLSMHAVFGCLPGLFALRMWRADCRHCRRRCHSHSYVAVARLWRFATDTAPAAAIAAVTAAIGALWRAAHRAMRFTRDLENAAIDFTAHLLFQYIKCGVSSACCVAQLALCVMHCVARCAARTAFCLLEAACWHTVAVSIYETSYFAAATDMVKPRLRIGLQIVLGVLAFAIGVAGQVRHLLWCLAHFYCPVKVPGGWKARVLALWLLLAHSVGLPPRTQLAVDSARRGIVAALRTALRSAALLFHQAQLSNDSAVARAIVDGGQLVGDLLRPVLFTTLGWHRAASEHMNVLGAAHLFYRYGERPDTLLVICNHVVRGYRPAVAVLAFAVVGWRLATMARARYCCKRFPPAGLRQAADPGPAAAPRVGGVALWPTAAWRTMAVHSGVCSRVAIFAAFVMGLSVSVFKALRIASTATAAASRKLAPRARRLTAQLTSRGGAAGSHALIMGLRTYRSLCEAAVAIAATIAHELADGMTRAATAGRFMCDTAAATAFSGTKRAAAGAQHLAAQLALRTAAVASRARVAGLRAYCSLCFAATATAAAVRKLVSGSQRIATSAAHHVAQLPAHASSAVLDVLEAVLKAVAASLAAALLATATAHTLLHARRFAATRDEFNARSNEPHDKSEPAAAPTAIFDAQPAVKAHVESANCCAGPSTALGEVMARIKVPSKSSPGGLPSLALQGSDQLASSTSPMIGAVRDSLGARTVTSLGSMVRVRSCFAPCAVCLCALHSL